MNRSDIVRALAQRRGIPHQEAEALLTDLLETVLISLACGESVTIRHFGKFEVRERKAVTRFNPRTGDEINVPAKKSVLFHAAPAMKTRVNK